MFSNEQMDIKGREENQTRALHLHVVWICVCLCPLNDAPSNFSNFVPIQLYAFGITCYLTHSLTLLFHNNGPRAWDRFRNNYFLRNIMCLALDHFMNYYLKFLVFLFPIVAKLLFSFFFFFFLLIICFQLRDIHS